MILILFCFTKPQQSTCHHSYLFLINLKFRFKISLIAYREHKHYENDDDDDSSEDLDECNSDYEVELDKNQRKMVEYKVVSMMQFWNEMEKCEFINHSLNQILFSA